MCILRLTMGIFIISQGILAHELVIIIMGSLFSILAMLNIGCCGTFACCTPTTNDNKYVVAKEITYEDLAIQKDRKQTV